MKIMEQVNFNEHYRAFKWALSKEWEDKNGLYSRIQWKVSVLKEEYNLTEIEIADELFEKYWRLGHYQKYDASRGSLNNWIAHYVCLYLNHLIRHHGVRAKEIQNQRVDPLDQRNWTSLEWIDQDYTSEDPDYQPEIVFDPTNPEDLLIAKELLEFIKNHFSPVEYDYLRGEIDLDDAAQISGMQSDSFRKKVARKRAEFCEAYHITEL